MDYGKLPGMAAKRAAKLEDLRLNTVLDLGALVDKLDPKDPDDAELIAAAQLLLKGRKDDAVQRIAPGAIPAQRNPLAIGGTSGIPGTPAVPATQGPAMLPVYDENMNPAGFGFPQDEGLRRGLVVVLDNTGAVVGLRKPPANFSAPAPAPAAATDPMLPVMNRKGHQVRMVARSKGIADSTLSNESTDPTGQVTHFVEKPRFTLGHH